MINSKYLFIPLLLVSTIFTLSGCGPSWQYARPAPTPTAEGAAIGIAAGASVGALSGTGVGAPIGAFVGGLAGCIIGNQLNTKRSLVERIQANHVQVIQIGSHLMFVLPTDLFFEAGTPLLNRNFDPVLNQIATLLRGFEKYSVKVSGYTDNTGSPLRNVGLSRQQAFTLANYLWTQGIDTRLLSSIGYGDQAPIASNLTPQGRAANRRIEITLILYVEPDDM